MKKRFIAVILAIVMVFSFTANVYAASITEKVDEIVNTIESNKQTTAKAIFNIAKLSASLARKAQSAVMGFMLDSENWEKAADMMMGYIVKIYDKLLGGSTPDSPDEPENPDIPDKRKYELKGVW